MKMVTNGYDMDSSLDAWAAKYGNPGKRTEASVSLTLTCGETFGLKRYRDAQVGCTPKMAKVSQL